MSAREIERAAIAAGKLAARVAALGYAGLAGDLRLTKSQLEQAARMARGGGGANDRSTVFVRLAARYVDASDAKLRPIGTR